VSDCSGNPFFARKKLWQKKIATESAVFLKNCWGCASDFLKRHAQKKDKNRNFKKIGTACFVPRNDR